MRDTARLASGRGGRFSAHIKGGGELGPRGPVGRLGPTATVWRWDAPTATATGQPEPTATGQSAPSLGVSASVHFISIFPEN